MMGMMKVSIFVFLTLMITMGCYGVTNPNDLRILNDFRKGLLWCHKPLWPSFMVLCVLFWRESHSDSDQESRS
ncbi:hypothetical protein JHK82_033397 [Glycine max]|nr:hypothetical protein JHK82_033397 [Glycine max]